MKRFAIVRNERRNLERLVDVSAPRNSENTKISTKTLQQQPIVYIVATLRSTSDSERTTCCLVDPPNGISTGFHFEYMGADYEPGGTSSKMATTTKPPREVEVCIGL